MSHRTTIHVEKPSYVLVHRVQCDAQDSESHEEHQEEQDYLDVPLLSANANRTTALKGARPLDDIEWYLEDHPDIHFAVINVYNCDQYHMEIYNDFERISLPPNLDSRVLSRVRPYLYVLKKNAKVADRVDQIIMPSPGLKQAMGALQTLYPIELDDWNATKNLTHPYAQLWHGRDLFSDVAKEIEPESPSHISSLREFLENEVSDVWTEAESLFEDGLVNKKHWTKLFHSNEPIVTMVDGEPRAYICKDNPELSDGKLLLECWSWEFDGQFFRQDFSFQVEWPHSSELVSITDLSYYPLSFGTLELRDRLQKRGEMFWLCRQRRYVSGSSSSQDATGKEARLRYMVDMTTYKLMHPPESDHTPTTRLDEGTMRKDKTPDAPNHPYFSLLMPPSIKGFGFHNKKWVDLLVEHIEDIRWNQNVFTKDLVLDKGKKDLIQALVTVHLERTVKMKADFMTGKGEGLLILLHGGPGTGKTLTAESVAELAARPLYRVTCGDIGTDPEEVEKYLNSVLFIGATWNCVVLLDEADVFLEERTKLDLQRNALVSVFLRVLEYYDGILILTSNRIGTFDEAFKSRVQLSLHYPPLTSKNRLRIWERFIALLEDGSDTSTYSEIREELYSLAKHELNGRQIRNTINTARQLAQFKREPLRYDHLELAINNVVDFEKYVTTLREQTDEEYAREQGLRHNNEESMQEHGFPHSNKKRKVDHDRD